MEVIGIKEDNCWKNPTGSAGPREPPRPQWMNRKRKLRLVEVVVSLHMMMMTKILANQVNTI